MRTEQLIRLKQVLLKNYCVNRDSKITFAEKNKVNINAWVDMDRDVQNVGDWLSVVVVKELAKHYQIDLDKKVNKTKHLYAIGSQLLGFQDATIFGGGVRKRPHTIQIFSSICAVS